MKIVLLQKQNSINNGIDGMTERKRGFEKSYFERPFTFVSIFIFCIY
jgi:hypothetical protein